MSIIWYLIWEIFAYESPAVHPTISESERNFIQQSIGDETIEVSNSFSLLSYYHLLVNHRPKYLECLDQVI